MDGKSTEGFLVPLLNNTAIPNVYVVEDMYLEERFSLYTYEILYRARSSGVGGSLIRYIVTNVEPVGWKAIWRSTPRSSGLKHEYDFVVEVQDVSQAKLEADVEVTHLLPSLLNSDDRPEQVVYDQYVVVPLCELHPVYDESDAGQFDQTAVAIENVRFFHDNIWRPWDDDDDEDPVFVDKHLMHRLQLYYDMQSGRIPSQTATQIQQLLCKAKSVSWKIEDLQNEMNCSDFDLELKEADVFQCMELNQELEKLHNQLQRLENPILSALVARHNQLKSSMVKSRTSGEPPYYHIVAEKLTAGTLNAVLAPLAGEVGVECHKTLRSALASTCDGDHVLLMPGSYSWEGSGWLEDSITLRGLGQTPEKTVLTATLGDGDIFINSSSKNLILENLKLVPSSSMRCALMVHQGCTQVKSCHILGAETGVTAIGGARLDLIASTVQDCLGIGIECHHESSVNIENSIIRDCRVAGLLLQVLNNETENCRTAQVSISTTTFSSSGFGILVGLLDEKKAPFQVQADDFFIRFISKECKVANNAFDNNQQGNVGQVLPTNCSISLLEDKTASLSLFDTKAFENDGTMLNNKSMMNVIEDTGAIKV